MLDVPTDLHKELKILSAVHGVTMGNFIVEAIREKIQKEGNPLLNVQSNVHSGN